MPPREPADPDAPEPSRWELTTRANPDHSSWYINRWRTMIANGEDVDGEARLADALAPRNARILDAGCGQGRVGARLQALGHTVVGVDVDPQLIAAAEEDYPGPRWVVGDLARLDLGEQFDVIISAGNVMGFLAESTRAEVVRRLAEHLAPEGRLVVGFGAGRGYDFDEFLGHARQAGLASQLLLESWDVRPFTSDSQFLVAVLSG